MMKKLLLWLVFLSIGMQAQNIDFADPNFKAKLLEANTTNDIARDVEWNALKIDVNNDGEISLSEANAIARLKINAASVNSIEGIKGFANLIQFSLNWNPITKIDLADIPASLEILDVSSNSLTSIDNLSLAVNLQTLDCSQNKLQTIDLSNIKIKKLYCTDNQLSILSFQDGSIQQLETLQTLGNHNLLKICKDSGDILPTTGIPQMVCNTVGAIDFDPGLKAILIRSSPSDSDPYWHVKDVNGNFINPDLNNDKELTQDEADLIGYINILQGSGNVDNFETTKGINYLRNLKGISGGISSMNSRTTGGVGNIDIDGLKNLEYIDLARFFVNSINIKNASNLKTIYTGTHHNYGPGNSVFFNFENCPSLISISAEHSNLKSLSFQNCPTVKTIELTGNNLSSLDISMLPDLETLHIGNYATYHDQGSGDDIDFPNNGITTLNLTNNTKLKDLDCNKNSLISLDVLSCSLLERINCSKNQLTSLDIHGLNLTGGDFNPFYQKASLDCGYNNITDLNINNTKIAILFCKNNKLSNLDLSSSTVFNLNCSFNNLANIDLTNQASLNYLDCQHNNLTTLNLDNNLYLNGIDCSYNNLTQLKISNKYELNELRFSDNPSLEYLFMKNGNNDAYLLSFNLNDGISPYKNTIIKYICADDSEIDALKSDLQLWNLNDININTYCTFTPGDSYNTISGTAKYDVTGNGCDTADNAFEYLKLKIDDGTNSGETFVQNDGKYEFNTQEGNFSITAQAENPSLFTVSPANFSTTFADSNNNSFTQNICVTANGTQNDAEVVIAPLTGARPGFEATYKLVWRNKGNTTLSGKVIMNFDSGKMTFKESSLPYSLLSNGSIEFNYSNLKPFANDGAEITFTINTPTNPTNPVNSGDILAFNAQITPSNGDLTPEDNNFGFNHTVVNSFDPNDIVCMEGEKIPTVAVGKYMHYVVNFENIGTAEAENIVVKMEIDPAEFDINTLQLQNASATVTTKITGNIVEFIFKKIKLKGGGKGNVLLKMKSLTSLQEGDKVNNKANIYFDYNFPVETNDYVTTIQDQNSVLAAKINYTADDFTSGNYPINFDATLSTGDIASYVWEFSGNPSVSSTTSATPVVTYSNQGNYTAKLTVYDADNNASTQTISFKIGDSVANLSTGKDSNGNSISIDSDDDDWEGFDINGTQITPKVRHTFSGWSNADIGNGNTSQWITLNTSEGYYTYKSVEFTIPENATDAKLNLRSLSFVRNWTSLVKINPNGSEDETEITKTQWMSDGAKGWLNSRSPKVDNYALLPGRYYIKVLVYSNNGNVRQSLDVNAMVTCSEGLIYRQKMAPTTTTLNTDQIKMDQIKIYPIPTKGEVNIAANEAIKNVEVYDSTGRIIQIQNFDNQSKNVRINITSVKGIYYLKIKTIKEVTTKKIIKE